MDHLARGRFILGLGSGETENTVPYGFDFARPVARFEESLRVMDAAEIEAASLPEAPKA